MSYPQNIGAVFDFLTPLFKEVFKSPYINLGYWDRTTKTIAQAQEKMVRVFGEFSKLGKSFKIIDVGCGTGEQDLYFLDHFHCKKILGINISSLQIDIAKKKIKNKKKYLSRIQFEVGDALQIKRYSPESYDRVLSLECAQYLDKKKFVRGAYYILRSKGYLCIADPIFNFPYSVNEKLFPGILERIKDETIKKNYGFQLENKMSDSLKNVTQPFTGILKEIHISYEENIKYLKEIGFKIEEVRDISDYVNQFYPAIEKRILKLLKKKSLSYYQTDHYLNYLISSYINYCAYLNGLARFYLMRAVKL